MKTTSAITVTLLATAAQAFNFGKPPPEPVEDLVKGFRWTKDPFTLPAMESLKPTCKAKAVFAAREYTLSDLLEPAPAGLLPWSKGLKNLLVGREYPGGWAGLDRHLVGRNLLLMDYAALPVPVREWIEEQERTDGEAKTRFAVFARPAKVGDEIETAVEFPPAGEIDRAKDDERIVIFAPGALYDILPLWVAAGSACPDDLLDLTKYKPEPEDGHVVAWVQHSEPQDKAVQMTIEAHVVKAKAKESKPASSKEEL